MWPVEWFTEHEIIMPNGEPVNIRLAEMGSLVGSGKKTKIWMREVRKLTDSGHQTSLISTAYDMPDTRSAAYMFSRWCQENFFRYMMQHFAIDLINEYGTQEFPDTEKVINPNWRDMDRKRNSIQNKLRYRRARFTEMTMHPESEDNSTKYGKWVRKKSNLLEEIEQYENELVELKKKIKETDKHITWAELDENDKFYRLLPGRKRLMDTIRMIAYRSETAMMKLLIGPTVNSADARRLLQNLFVTEADILPEPGNNLLRVRVHGASTQADNRALLKLIHHLNESEVLYPGTEMCICYELLGFSNSD
jgi:hypothetical protein